MKILVSTFFEELNKLDGIYNYENLPNIETYFTDKTQKSNFLNSDFSSIVFGCSFLSFGLPIIGILFFTVNTI